jgi:hypothetical protein
MISLGPRFVFLKYSRRNSARLTDILKEVSHDFVNAGIVTKEGQGRHLSNLYLPFANVVPDLFNGRPDITSIFIHLKLNESYFFY